MSKTPKGQAHAKRRGPSLETIHDLWARLVKERDNFECRLSEYLDPKHAWGALESHHIFFSRFKATQFLVDNGLTVRVGIHRWVHAHPAESRKLIRKVIGAELYDYLESIHKREVEDTATWREACLDALRGGE